MAGLGFDIKERDFVPDEYLLTEKERKEIYQSGKIDALNEAYAHAVNDDRKTLLAWLRKMTIQG